MSKKGLSIVIAIIILAFFSLVSSVVLWFVFENVPEENIEASLSLVNISIDPLSVIVLTSDYGNANISLKIKKNSLMGDIDALKFIIYEQSF